MNTFSVYIITDNNRKYLNVSITDDMSHTLNELFNTSNILFSNNLRLNRIIYVETFEDCHLAIQRQKELNQYTRMQKEKLVRKHNPNWINIYPQVSPIQQKRAVTYVA